MGVIFSITSQRILAGCSRTSNVTIIQRFCKAARVGHSSSRRWSALATSPGRAVGAGFKIWSTKTRRAGLQRLSITGQLVAGKIPDVRRLLAIASASDGSSGMGRAQAQSRQHFASTGAVRGLCPSARIPPPSARPWRHGRPIAMVRDGKNRAASVYNQLKRIDADAAFVGPERDHGHAGLGRPSCRAKCAAPPAPAMHDLQARQAASLAIASTNRSGVRLCRSILVS